MFKFWDGIPRSKHTWNNKTWMGILGWIQKWRPEGMDIFHLMMLLQGMDGYGCLWWETSASPYCSNASGSNFVIVLETAYPVGTVSSLPRRLSSGSSHQGLKICHMNPPSTRLCLVQTGSGLRNSMNHVRLSWHGNFMKLPVLAKKTQGMIGLL
jgi:hypothetical protein